MASNLFTVHTKLFWHKDVNLRTQNLRKTVKLPLEDFLKISHRCCWSMDHRPETTHFSLGSTTHLKNIATKCWHNRTDLSCFYIYRKHIYTKYEFAFILLIAKHLITLIKKYILFSKERKNTAFAFMSYQPGNIMKWLHPERKFEGHEKPGGSTFHRKNSTTRKKTPKYPLFFQGKFCTFRQHEDKQLKM